MVDDPNRKTPRQFQCRDYLWDSFEQLSGELECSVDYLINESMRHYLRAQGRGATLRAPSVPGATAPVAAPTTIPGGISAPSRVVAGGPVQSGRQPAAYPAAPPSRAQMPAAQPRAGAPGVGPVAATPPPRAPSQRPGQPAPADVRAASMPAMIAPPAVSRPTAPPVTAPAPAPPAAAPGQRVLYAVCGDQKVPVTKEEFIIGRGQKMCDLVIRDTNISRQHARVVLHNGQYWIVDNQSTNGVEFRGTKIQQKRVDDGDIFSICGHEIQFLYR